MDHLDWEEDQQDDESGLSLQVQEGEGGVLLGRRMLIRIRLP